MKKKLIFMAMLTVLLALSFMSCEEDPQKVIVVTEIPSTSGYNYGYVGLGDSGSKVVALSTPVPISSSHTLTAELLSTAKGNPAFTDSGTYTFVLVITSDSDGKSSVWEGGKLSLNIKEETTKVSFNTLTKTKSSSSINIIDNIKSIRK